MDKKTTKEKEYLTDEEEMEMWSEINMLSEKMDDMIQNDERGGYVYDVLKPVLIKRIESLLTKLKEDN